MTLQDYNKLTYEKRINAIKKAVCIGRRDEGIYTVFLYQLNSFYIEAFQHKRFFYICAVEGFDDLDRLDPYLEMVEISHSY